MQVVYVGSKEFDKLTPCPDTVVIDLTAHTDGVIEDTKWKDYLLCRFEVLSDRGEFAPIDNQAKKLAIRIYPYIKDAKKVICKCEYGEIRSVAVARGIAYSDMGLPDIHTYKNGKLVYDDPSGSSTFSGRTTRWISDIIDELAYLENECPAEIITQCKQILDRIQTMAKRPESIIFIDPVKRQRYNDALKIKLRLNTDAHSIKVLDGIDVKLDTYRLRDGQTIKEFIKENGIKDALIVVDASNPENRYVDEVNNVETITLYSDEQDLSRN